MDDELALKEAARIMREHKPKTIGELFGIARRRSVEAGELSAFLDIEGDCENGWGWRVVDAHLRNHKNNEEYRAAAGLSPSQQ